MPMHDHDEEGKMVAWGVLAAFFGILGLLLGVVIGVLGAVIYFNDRITRAEEAQRMARARLARANLAKAGGAGEGPEEAAEATPESEEPVEPDDEEPFAPDDLTQIKGVGQVYATRLRDAGITTYEQMADMSPEEIGKTVDLDPGRIVSEEWTSQARALAGEAEE